MKRNIQKATLIIATLVLSASSFGQKKNETSAAVEFKNNFQTALMSGDMEKAKKSLIAAKGFIDLAAENPETKESPKTLWLKGEIYSNFLVVGMQTADTNFMKMAGDDALDVSIASFKKGYEVSDKFDGDIRQSAYQKHDMIDGAAIMLYKAGNFKEAAAMYETEARFFDAVGEIDSTSLFNAALSYEKAGDYQKAAEGYSKLARIGYKGTTTYALASSAYRRNKQVEEAKSIISEGRKKYPTEKELLLEQVNLHIDAGDAAGAETALNEAIASDPNNKQLHYTIGTIYIDLKQNEKAEASLMKALEIDPNYTDAMYQLGAHLITWAGEVRTAAGQLKLNDPNYDKMVKQADAIYGRAVAPLENYIAKVPNDKEVLTILSQLYRNLGNFEKSAEYKKKADAIK